MPTPRNPFLPTAAEDDSDDGALPVFCLPQAGAGASTYRSWPAPLGPGLRVRPVQLPGRENLFSRPMPSDAAELVRTLRAELADELDRPHVLFGHSMGGFLAAELAAAAQRDGTRPPDLLVVSGWSEPSGRTPLTDRPDLAGLPDEEVLRTWLPPGPATDVVVNTPELREIVLEVLRADLRLCAAYRPSFDLLRVPVLAVGGEDDPLCPVDGLRAWARRTAVRCRVRVWPGGHPVTEERVAAIGDAIRAELDRS
ncbi:thioesterase II family protein [Actinoalloteichus spitiensis]|uniref:thioesterase II family protein n=1 Tax=Actinoalloteichus spitiensis TaxID=252394 RepID=UPI000366562E|nr:alpha/beta fold hydrolase [Actinoalloteichus spitiensis]